MGNTIHDLVAVTVVIGTRKVIVKVVRIVHHRHRRAQMKRKYQSNRNTEMICTVIERNRMMIDSKDYRRADIVHHQEIHGIIDTDEVDPILYEVKEAEAEVEIEAEVEAKAKAETGT